MNKKLLIIIALVFSLIFLSLFYFIYFSASLVIETDIKGLNVNLNSKETILPVTYKRLKPSEITLEINNPEFENLKTIISTRSLTETKIIIEVANNNSEETISQKKENNKLSIIIKLKPVSDVNRIDKAELNMINEVNQINKDSINRINEREKNIPVTKILPFFGNNYIFDFETIENNGAEKIEFFVEALPNKTYDKTLAKKEINEFLLKNNYSIDSILITFY